MPPLALLRRLLSVVLIRPTLWAMGPWARPFAVAPLVPISRNALRVKVSVASFVMKLTAPRPALSFVPVCPPLHITLFAAVWPHVVAAVSPGGAITGQRA